MGYHTAAVIPVGLVEQCLKHTVCERLLLLLFDGHSTHYQPDVVQFVKDNDALMLCLPPNTTNEASPLQGHSQKIFLLRQNMNMS